MNNRSASHPLRAVANPPNPFHNQALEWEGVPPRVELKVFEDHSRSILSRNSSPDIPFTWSINPYRGCMHACSYCYARPTHEYLDFGAGTDFDRVIVVKPNAPELLRDAFMKRSWTGELIVFSGNTDCYQPLEAEWRLTRRLLQVCHEFRNPVSIITKSALIERDLDVLLALQEVTQVHVTLSIPFMDADACRRVEPFAPTPTRRLKAVRRLSEAGIPTSVNVAPIIPGLNDGDIPAILEAAAAAGALGAGRIAVRLPGPVASVFEARLRDSFPLRADRVMSRILDMRGKDTNETRFHDRMRGQGNYWAAVDRLFETTCRRVGLTSRGDQVMHVSGAETFRRPGEGRQLDLF